MEKKLSLVLLLSLLIMFLLVATHATITESPAPQPQPPNTSPMNGTTPGSLHPQGALATIIGKTKRRP
ncbi:hypothetical protein HAX54_040544 [Datura stramonium]|uniref:Uncharacterized protein n=1 Tax=Datura stramonium TaxID=4076 RepID=A0ABS8SKF7_DATST|nr:hypothetical protein [Datura stramonium]